MDEAVLGSRTGARALTREHLQAWELTKLKQSLSQTVPELLTLRIYHIASTAWASGMALRID